MKLTLAPAAVLVALLSLSVRADIAFPVSPAERDGTILGAWNEVPIIVLAECLSTADARGPARIRIVSTMKGAPKPGDTLHVPVLQTTRNSKGADIPADVALQKDSTYVLFLKESGKGHVLSPHSLVRMWSYQHPDGTELLENGGAKVVGKPEDCRVWQVFGLLRKAESGTEADRAVILRMRIRAAWDAGSVCSPQLLREIDALGVGEEPAHRVLVTTLLREDLPLLGHRDAALDAYAASHGIEAGDPWRWAEAPRAVEFDLRAYEVAARGGEDAERAAARASFAEICRNGNRYRWGHLRNLPKSRVFLEEFRAAFRAATTPTLDWSRLCGLSAVLTPETPLEEQDVAALVRIVTSPEFSGACGETSLGFAGALTQLSGCQTPHGGRFYDPSLVSAPVAAWWEKEGSKHGRFHPAAK